jgi:hypothetical protein
MRSANLSIVSCDHRLGLLKSTSSIFIRNNYLEAVCSTDDSQAYQSLAAKLSFAHAASMFLRVRLESDKTELDFWEDLARSVRLDAAENLEFSTQHITSFDIVDTSTGFKAYLLYEV